MCNYPLTPREQSFICFICSKTRGHNIFYVSVYIYPQPYKTGHSYFHVFHILRKRTPILKHLPGGTLLPIICFILTLAFSTLELFLFFTFIFCLSLPECMIHKSRDCIVHYHILRTLNNVLYIAEIW